MVLPGQPEFCRGFGPSLSLLEAKTRLEKGCVEQVDSRAAEPEPIGQGCRNYFDTELYIVRIRRDDGLFL